MKRMFYWLAIAAPMLVSFVPDAGCEQQGIQGHVYRVSGNQMPSPDASRSKPAGMKTTLYVYELTNASQATQEGAYYKSISTKLVKEIASDDSGYFKAKLKPGWYSLFVKKGELFYSNIFDDKMNIHPVEIKNGEWKEEDFKVDYDAVY